MSGTLLELFWSCVKIGLLAFGGGNAAIPLLEAAAVPRWMSQQEFGELVSINFAFPGISILKLAGMAGLAWPSAHHRGIQPPRAVPGPWPRAPQPGGHAVCCGSTPGQQCFADGAVGLGWPVSCRGGGASAGALSRRLCHATGTCPGAGV